MTATAEEFIRHVITEHGFGLSESHVSVIGLASPATREYHRYLHETRDDLGHEHEELL